MMDKQKAERGGWILVVEDDTDSGDVLAEILGKEGFQVIRAKTAQEARSKLSRQSFRGVLLDLKLGHQNGEPIISYMRGLTGVNDQTPILVISGQLDSTTIERLRPMVQGILVKPFAEALFLERLRTALQTPVPYKKH